MQIGKPEKQGSKVPFIKHTKNEGGITLIALIVSIIILILLAAVSLKAITGEEAILDTSTKVTNEYNIEQYKERVAALRDISILKYEMIGETVDLEKIVKTIREETTWIKSAVANLDKEENNEDIVIVTSDNYVYEVCYYEEYGQRFVEYLGREDGKAFPTVIARYNEETSQIEVIANAKKSETVKSIEIIHKGEIIAKAENNNLNKGIDKSGWYEIKVTAKDRKAKICMDKSSKCNKSTNNSGIRTWSRRARK